MRILFDCVAIYVEVNLCVLIYSKSCAPDADRMYRLPGVEKTAVLIVGAVTTAPAFLLYVFRALFGRTGR